MNGYKYFLTQRPPMPGAFPSSWDNKPVEVEDFGRKKYCADIYREAWGYVVYPHILSISQINAYELTEGYE